MAEKALILNENTTAAELRGHRNGKWVTKKQSAAAEQRALFCVFARVV